MDSQAKQILIIDDHLLFAQGLELLLNQLQPQPIIDICEDAQLALEQQLLGAAKDLIIIDLHMPGMTGFNFLSAAKKQKVQSPILVISGVESRSEIERAISLGANGFVPKDSSGQEMIAGVSEVLEGKRYLPKQWEGKINWETEPVAELDVITETIGPRQIEVLNLLQDGLQNKQIALVLGVSVSTIKSHTQLLYRALNVTNRTACIQVAIKRGLI